MFDLMKTSLICIFLFSKLVMIFNSVYLLHIQHLLVLFMIWMTSVAWFSGDIVLLNAIVIANKPVAEQQ